MATIPSEKKGDSHGRYQSLVTLVLRILRRTFPKGRNIRLRLCRIGRIGMREFERGVSMVVVAVIVVIAAIFLVSGYMMYARNVEIDTAKQANDAKEDEVRNKLGEYSGERMAVSDQSGWLIEGKRSESDPNAIRAFLEARGTSEYLKRSLTVQGLCTILEESLAHAEMGENEARLNKEIAEKSLESCRGRLGDIRTKKDNFLRGISDDIKRLNTEVNAENDSFTEKSENLKEAKIALERQKDNLAKKTAEERSELKTKKIQKQQELEALTKKEAMVKTMIEVDGVVDWVSPDGEYAYINLGKDDRLVKGTKFGVFEYGKAGSILLKGEVEAKTVYDTMTKVSVTRTADPYDPVKPGDYIFNPVYDKERPRVFVFAGKFDAPEYVFKKDEMKKRIEAIGGSVDDQVTLKTDFVIVGEDFQDDANYGKAGEIGILVIPVKELFPYLAD